MQRHKGAIVLTSILVSVSMPVSAMSPRSVIDSNEQEKITKLKETIYEKFNSRYAKNIAMLNDPKNSGKVAYSIKIASSLQDLESASNLLSYAQFEKEFDKLYESLDYGEKIVLRYTSYGRHIDEETLVDYNINKYNGSEQEVSWSILEDGKKIGRIPLSPDTETGDVRYITVKVGDTKLDLSRPIFRQKNGYYIDKNGDGIKRVNDLQIETKESLPNGIIDGYYEDSSNPIKDCDKIEDTEAIIKSADESTSTNYTVSDIYDTKAYRLNMKGNELFNYINSVEGKENYTVSINGISSLTAYSHPMYIDYTNEDDLVIKYIDNDKVVEAKDLSAISFIIGYRNNDKKYIKDEYIIKPSRNAGLENILNILTQKNKTKTFAGMDRYLTSTQVSKNGWKNGSEDLVIVSGDNNALVDGLTATPLAASMNAPILLTKKNEIPQCVIDEIDRLGVKNVYIVGGYNSVSKEVSDKLYRYYGKNVNRIEGNDRYETSIAVGEAVAKKSQSKVDTFVVGGNGMADALSISSVAGSKKSPIILTKSNGLSSDAKHFLSSYSNDAYTVGGKNNISNQVIIDILKLNIDHKNLSGENRQDTNAAVIKEFYTENKELYENGSVVFSKSEDVSLVDALGAGALASNIDAPIVLASNELSEEQEDILTMIKNKDKAIEVGYGISSNVLERFFYINR